MLFSLFVSDFVEFFSFTVEFYIPESREVPASSDEAGRAETRSFGRAVRVLRPCGQGEIASVAARPTTSDSAGLCNPVVHDFHMSC